jgi:tRNA(Ile)-lysidine synthase
VKDSEALRELTSLVESTGLLRPGSDGVVMVSGGADSACAATAAVRICGPQAVAAVHVNYGLHDRAGEGERAARELCSRLRIDLHVERPKLGKGNVQARAREARYRAAEALRSKLGAQWIATGHTRTDVAETVLYRLTVSPGTRALRGMRPRSAKVVRPLHRLSRGQVRELARGASLPFADDPTNDALDYARNRIRAEVMPLLAEIGSEAERNIAETHAELLEEGEILDRLAAESLADAGLEHGRPLAHEELAVMPAGLRRLVLRAAAERAAGRPVPLSRARARRIERLAASPEGGVVELPRGVRAVCEAGTVRFAGAEPAKPKPVRLTVPGSARFGEWELRAEVRDSGTEPAGPELATLDLDATGDELEVRTWEPGDKIRPLGLGGTKTLQDLFTDSGVPRSLRRRLPVVVAGGRIAWVAGVAISDDFRLVPGSRGAAVITVHAAKDR